MRHPLEEFEAFWTVYPRRAGNPKDAARKQWMKLHKEGQLPALCDMIAAAKAYAADIARNKVKPEFIAHARTWLSQKRFLDWKPAADTPLFAAAQPRDPFADVPACLKDYVIRNPHVWDYYLKNCLFDVSDTKVRIRPASTFDADRIERFYLSDLRAAAQRDVAIESTVRA